MRSKLSRIVLLVAAACTLVPAIAAAQTTLRFNRWLPPNHFIMKELLEPWVADVEKATEGRVRIEFPASSLGPPPRQFDLVTNGIADIVWAPHAYTPDRFPTSQALELPFLGDRAEALSVAYWRTHQQHFAKLNEFERVKLLSLHVQPPQSLFANAGPIKSIDDVRGLKVRIPGPTQATIVDKLGGVSVAAPSSKAYELISRGVADAIFFTPDAVAQFNILDYVKSQVDVEGGFGNSSFYLAFNKASWDRLSKQDQEAIEALSGEAFAKRAGAVWDRVSDAAQEQLKQRGVQIHTVTGAELERLRELIGPMEDAWIEAMAKRGVDGAAALEMIRREAAAYQASN